MRIISYDEKYNDFFIFVKMFVFAAQSRRGGGIISGTIGKSYCYTRNSNMVAYRFYIIL